MKIMIRTTFVFLLAACSGASSAPDIQVSIDVPVDVNEPAQDEGATDVVLAEDTAVPLPAIYEPTDDKLRASVAYGSMGVPLGASTSGYGQTPADDAPESPFAEVFQATDKIVHEPGVRVLNLVKGENRTVLVVTDIVGIYYTHFEHLVDRVQARTGVDISEYLVFMANHSHAGPARLVNLDLAAFVMDKYNAAYTFKVIDRIADAVIDAMTKEAIPVQFGHAVTENSEMHKDRRCENPEYQNDRMGVLRFEKADGSGPLALIINYAMHGTVLAPEDACLSGDAPRAVEQKVHLHLNKHSRATSWIFTSWKFD